jgi:hypothetical protein
MNPFKAQQEFQRHELPVPTTVPFGLFKEPTGRARTMNTVGGSHQCGDEHFATTGPTMNREDASSAFTALGRNLAAIFD